MQIAWGVCGVWRLAFRWDGKTNRARGLRVNSRPAALLVPARRLFQTNLDGLLFFLDLVPASERLPTLGHDLNQQLAPRDFGDLGETLVVGLHVPLELLVLRPRAFLHEFYIHTGVLNGLTFFSRSDLDAQPGDSGGLLRLCLRRWLSLAEGRCRQQQGERPEKEASFSCGAHGANSNGASGGRKAVPKDGMRPKWPGAARFFSRVHAGGRLTRVYACATFDPQCDGAGALAGPHLLLYLRRNFRNQNSLLGQPIARKCLRQGAMRSAKEAPNGIFDRCHSRRPGAGPVHRVHRAAHLPNLDLCAGGTR